MAFLDNSGDIILDAVLTDVGRKRMAQGDFKISKFAIGDDEIDYGLYNKNHPSGSAYYDLEILQTPVLEAFTQNNANINYGLMSFTKQNLLYLPTAKINNKMDEAVRLSSNGVIFVHNGGTAPSDGTSLTTALETDLSAADSKSVLNSNSTSKCILIETGIDDSSINPTSAEQSSKILSNGLADNTFRVAYDRRFIDSISGPTSGTTFTNSGGVEGVLTLFLTEDSALGTDTLVENYNSAEVLGILNTVYKDGDGTDRTDTNASVIAGPRSTFTALNITPKSGLKDDGSFTKFGKTGQTVGGAISGKTYDFLDTIVYINGASTNVSIQIPIRIIQFA